MVSKDQIYDILREVDDPELHRPITDLGMVENVNIDNGTVAVKIKLTIPGCPMKARISDDITNKLESLQGVNKGEIEFGSMNDEERAKLRQQLMPGAKAEDDSPNLDFVKEIICVASGKGGVGKSTVTANLAAALSELGLKVGVLDADVYGFSIPRMLGVTGQPTIIDNMIIPPERNGIKLVSMGLFLDEDTPVIWRGPLLHKTVQQFMTDVHWDKLDVMLVDLPPGTGDITITVAQKMSKARLLVVTTPQKAASNVALRVGKMAEKVELGVLGVIENMSFFQLPDGSKEYVFGQGGGSEVADILNTSVFAEIPLDSELRQASDEGNPIIWSEKDSPARQAYLKCADRLKLELKL